MAGIIANLPFLIGMGVCVSVSAGLCVCVCVCLQRHYSPAVRGYATHLLHGAPTQGRHALHPNTAKMYDVVTRYIDSLVGLV